MPETSYSGKKKLRTLLSFFQDSWIRHCVTRLCVSAPNFRVKNENISTSLDNLVKVDYYRTKELDNSVLLLRYTLYTAPVQHQIHVKQFTNKCDLKCKAKSIKKQKPNQNCFDITRKVKSHLFSSVECWALRTSRSNAPETSQLFRPWDQRRYYQIFFREWREVKMKAQVSLVSYCSY